MTDFKHFPRLPRHTQVPVLDFNTTLFLVLVVLILLAMSAAGKSDQFSAGVVDREQILEQTKKAINSDERAALYFYNQQAAR